MRQKEWRGTALFVIILAVSGATVGLKLYGTGLTSVGTTHAISEPQSGNTVTSSPSTPPALGPVIVPAPAVVPATRTVNGNVVNTEYGPIQVAVTFSGNKITAVSELQAPNDRRLSVAINTNAAPILAQEVLNSQSSNIDTVSGATYTTEGYARSVQSAIDKR